MRTDGDALGERLRRALGRAGIVTGYLHSCRRCKRNRNAHEEQHADNERRWCPRCGMVLWAKPIPKKLRLHDTRHTTATLLLAGGADLYAVARILRHTDPKVTFETYAHLVPGYLHAQVDRLSAVVPPMANIDGSNSVPAPSNNVPAACGTETPVGAVQQPQESHRSCSQKDRATRKVVGAPGRSRTCGPRLRRPLLYPAELQAPAGSCADGRPPRQPPSLRP